MKKYTFFILSAFTGLVLFTQISACKKPAKEAELITTVKVFLTDSATQQTTEFIWRDQDGDGGSNPDRRDTIFIAKNSTYTASISFLDESGNESKDITEEIVEEAKEHIVCYDVTGDGLSIRTTDSDGQYRIGLKSIWKVESPSDAGVVRINLKHQPGIKDGSCDPGESDADVTFIFKAKP